MAQMVLAEHHDMAFPADRADQPLSYAFCQGERGESGGLECRSIERGG